MIPDSLTDDNSKYLLTVLLLIAKNTIKASWLKPQPPNIMQWRNRVKNMLIVEKNHGKTTAEDRLV